MIYINLESFQESLMIHLNFEIIGNWRNILKVFTSYGHVGYISYVTWAFFSPFLYINFVIIPTEKVQVGKDPNEHVKNDGRTPSLVLLACRSDELKTCTFLL